MFDQEKDKRGTGQARRGRVTRGRRANIRTVMQASFGSR